MEDAGAVEAVVPDEEAVESPVLSFVFCALLLHDANDNTNAPSKMLEMVRFKFIAVVFKN